MIKISSFVFLLEFPVACLLAKDRARFQAGLDALSESRETSALLVNACEFWLHVAAVDAPKHLPNCPIQEVQSGSFRTQVPHVVSWNVVLILLLAPKLRTVT